MSATDVLTIPPITRAEVESLAADEYARLADQLRSLADDDWAKPTDCPLWNVRAVAGHCVGMMGDFTSFRALMRRMVAATRAAKSSGGLMVDSMTAMQVADNADLTRGELIDRIDQIGPKAARWRAGAPALFRRIPMKQPFGDKVETWSMGYLLDTIITRDPWMHRVDISMATGRPMVLAAEHDGRLVADVVAEWARRHGQPFTLELTGPVGGEFVAGGGGERITLDAVEFCRTLSGRASGVGLMNQEVPF